MRGDYVRHRSQVFALSQSSQWSVDDALCHFQVLLLVAPPRSGRISTASAESLSQIISDTDGRNERGPAVLTLGLCALIVVLFVMFQPYVVAFIVICFGWRAHRQLMK